MSQAAYVVGIDLGTTNSALSYSPRPETQDHAELHPETFPVLQLYRPASLRKQPSLASFLYLPAAAEITPASLDLPWAEGRDFAVGEYARLRGAEVPTRLIHSSKSWLSHSGVNRSAAILPPDAPEDCPKLSPVTAAVRVLEHLKAAWDAEKPEAPLASQAIFLTVPASFDAIARELTLEAAHAAGLPEITLLEEPMAAFYAWLAANPGWRDQLEAGDRLLIVDVGGGTTDFSLIEVKEGAEGQLELERVAVGDHILLGGDNMDLALAHQLHQRLRESGKKLDPSQQRALVQAARKAKEELLSDPTLGSVSFSLLGKGSKLIGGQIKVEVDRQSLESVLIDGFFPACEPSERPSQARTSGFMELGLPYVADPGITRHLASFLGRHSQGRAPTHLLFNGGVFKSPLLRERLLGVMQSWQDRPLQLLTGTHADLAVSVGAAHFGARVLTGGLRIRGGVARSYYIGIESAMPAVPGVLPPIRALCVVQQGMEEGSQIDVPGMRLGLVVGEEVSFRFFTATHRKDDQPGQILDEYSWPDELTEIAPVHARLEAQDLEPGSLVPVRLVAELTELGTLQLWSVGEDPSTRWRLEYELREDAAS